MFENLSDKFERAFKVLKGHGRITELNVADAVKDIRKALLDADVNFKIAKTFTDQIKEKALGQNVITSVSPGQMMTKIVHDELVALMGSEKVDINVKINPSIILMSGLQGSGKTTFSAKLASYLKSKKGKNVLLVACDVYRPAAIEQLKILGQQINVDVYSESDNKEPVKIAKNAIAYAKEKAQNVIIIDTAGRLAIDKEMMDEISNIKKEVNPHETLFVVDAMTGQDAVNTAKAFNDIINFDGVILTKLDGDTRGGAALTIRSVVNKPIKFVGIGEKLDALDIFYPERMADRILGMGDIVTLVERAQANIDVEESKRLQKKIAKNQFNFNDFLQQIQQVKKMGNMKDLIGMIPGIGKAVKDVDIDESSFKGIEAIISSMTLKERETPSLLNGSRKKRIAEGSGTSIQEVNNLINQFEQAYKMMKSMQGGNMRQNMMRMMQQQRRGN